MGVADAKEAKMKGFAAAARAFEEPKRRAVSAGRHIERVRAQALRPLVAKRTRTLGLSRSRSRAPAAAAARPRRASTGRIPR